MMAQEKHFLKSQEQFETLGELVRQAGREGFGIYENEDAASGDGLACRTAFRTCVISRVQAN